MKTRSRFRLIPTLVLAAVVLGVGYIIFPGANHTANGHEERQSLNLIITFMPEHREVPVKVSYIVGATAAFVGERVDRDAFTSPWQHTVLVKRGTLVTLGALQHAPGELRCFIKEDGVELSKDSNLDKPANLRSFVSCATTR